MGRDVKPRSGGIWGWLKGAFWGVTKSGAATETWRLIGPWVLAVMGAAGTTIVGIVTQAPALAIIVGASLVFAAVAFGAVKVQALLARPREPRLEAPDERLGLDASIERIEDVLAQGISIRPDPIGDALRRMADRPPPPPRRDTPLAEAILYALKGRWGLDFSGFDPHKDSYELETIKWQFEEKAEEGDVQVWGSEIWVEGRYRKIDPDDWKHLKIDWQSLTEGKPRTTAKSDDSANIDPRYNLMVNKAQIEREFPQSQTTPPPADQSPLASRPRLGNSHASVFGIDAPQTAAVVDIKNFGNATAHNVTYQAICGVFPQRPEDPPAFDKSGVLGLSEPGHTQNVQFIFEGSLSSAEVAKFQRDGGRSLYAILQVDYESESGEKFRRSIALYLDPQGARVDGKHLLNICPTGNDDRLLPPDSERPWHEGRSQLTIREGGCLAANVSPLEFERSEMAQSAAQQLRYFATTGAMPIATEPDNLRAARRAAVTMGGLAVPEVTLDTYIRKKDLEHFLDKSLRLWMEVQDPARRAK